MNEQTGHAVDTQRVSPRPTEMERVVLKTQEGKDLPLRILTIVDIDDGRFALMCHEDEVGDLPEEERSLYVFRYQDNSEGVEIETVDEDIYTEVLHHCADLIWEEDEEV